MTLSRPEVFGDWEAPAAGRAEKQGGGEEKGKVFNIKVEKRERGGEILRNGGSMSDKIEGYSCCFEGGRQSWKLYELALECCHQLGMR